MPVKPCEVPGQGPEAREPPAEFAEEARALHLLLSCQGQVPEGLDPVLVKGFCSRRAKLLARTTRRRAALEALLAQSRPARLPSATVSPLSGSDLVFALAANPDARNVTLTSTVSCGDPRLVGSLGDPVRLRSFLSAVEREGERLLNGEGGEVATAGGRLGALPALLWTLGVEGAAPVGLRYLRVEAAGTLRYLGARELAATERNERPSPFESCELAFLQRGEQPGAPARFVRNLRADLSDAAVATDPGPLAHLEAKGKFVAVFAGAGALAGERATRLRELLLRRASLVVSDGTGPTPEQVRQAGLVPERHPWPGARRDLVILRRP